jgi:formylglycine-generating enzyme required for sulfatase activity
MRELEVPLVEGRNSAAVDLFDPRHARKVLAAFGRAEQVLPEGALTREQDEFLERAVSGLAQDGKVIPVRLSLFAQMVRDKVWLPTTLKELGGAEGVGVAFLEQTFSGPSAAPEHRRHQQAARAVLRALLPEQGTDIKGHMRSREELLEASGYLQRPREFADLLRILDSQLRLLTPTEREEGMEEHKQSVSSVEGPSSETNSTGLYYQLTHDYLVPTLREWLTRKQKQTWRGRTDLRFAELTAQWAAAPSSRLLPSLPEYLIFGLAVPRRKQTSAQRALMRAALRRHALRGTALLSVLAVAAILLLGYFIWLHRTSEMHRAENLVERMLNDSPADFPTTLSSLEPVRDYALPLLKARYKENPESSRQRLHAAFALAALGEPPTEFLVHQVAVIPSSEARNLIVALAAARDAPLSELLGHVQSEDHSELRARYAIFLLQLGDCRGAEQLLSAAAAPADRAAFILGFAEWYAGLRPLDTMLEADEDPNYRSGMCAALGLVDLSSLALADRDAVAKAVTDLHVSARDAGTHSAAGWALRHWKIEPQELPPAKPAQVGCHWFVNGLGMTMLEIAPGSFQMGHPELTAATPHPVQLTRGYYIADCEVRVDQFQRFMEDSNWLSAEKPVDWRGPDSLASPDPSCPVQRVSWFDAVMFCNWLSSRERRQPCYRRNGEKQTVQIDGKDKTWDIWECDFVADGYRLPTEAEWEHASRAGTSTMFWFGDDAELLRYFGFYSSNSRGPDSKVHAQPVGTATPNQWGLFDMHGNVGQWCHDWFAPYTSNAQDPAGPSTGTFRICRGGSCFDIDPAGSASPARKYQQSDQRTVFVGFRVVCRAKQ